MGNTGWAYEVTGGIAGQHDSVARLAVSHAGNLGVRNELDGVCAFRVLCDADVVIIGHTCHGVLHDVLENASKTKGVEDLGLLLCRDVNALGVTATLRC